ncbi:MAG: hypothetical protein ACLTDR_01920 [Adlercreutzia equolifaciens]
MEDKELLEKIIAKQNLIIPAMEKTGETKDIPEKLRHAMAAAEEWADVIEKKEGRDKEARRWPVKQLAEEAHEHIALFDHETRQQIQEYCELVARLPTMTTPRSGCNRAASAISRGGRSISSGLLVFCTFTDPANPLPLPNQ